jgi:protein ImuB
MTRRRILSVWLPKLAIERWAKTSGCGPEIAAVLTIEAAHGPVIHAVTTAAAERGARPGVRLTDARAIDPALTAVPADPAGDLALLRRLACWSARWSPLIEMDGPDGLRLDVTGAAHLFGGEAGLSANVEERFAAMGLTARTAVAPTAGAAWALARFSPHPLCGEGSTRAQRNRGEGECHQSATLAGAAARRLSLPGEGGKDGLAALLAPLPVAALRLSPQATRTLERLGLKTIEALSGIERRSLARRFREADNPVDALDRMLGRKPEPLTGTPVEPPPRSTLRLAEPVADPAILKIALARLAGPLVRELGERRLGARRLAFQAFRVDGDIGRAEAETALATRDPAHIVRLLGDKVERLDPSFGFDAFALVAVRSEPLAPGQDVLIGEPPRELELARLIDRLAARLGTERVRRPERRESHLPERASRWGMAISSSRSRRDGQGDHGAKRHGGVGTKPLHHSTSSSGPHARAKLWKELQRPPRLLDRAEPIAVVYATPEGVPRRFVWRRKVHDIARVEGPERIAPEWWRQPSATRLRDYYRIEDSEGRRYWVYREGVIGDGRGGAPNWFMHGLFG